MPTGSRSRAPSSARPVHRVPVRRSLFAALRREFPDLAVTEASKGALVAASHLVEELLADAPGPSVLVSGFQRGGHWAVERDRYLALPGTRSVVLFAGEPVPEDAWDVTHLPIRLAASEPLAQEWFVLALGPGIAVVLCGLDGEDPHAGPPPLEEGDRLFEAIWSFDPAIVARAAEVVVEALEESAPEHAPAAREALAGVRPPADPREVAAVADRVISGMLGRLELERRRERDAERRASRATNDFLSRMSHELRNPLNAILGFTQLLELAALPDDDADAVWRIGRAGRHLLDLVNDVLDVTRVTAGELRLAPEEVPVGVLVEEAWLLVDGAARNRGLRVDLAGGLAARTAVRVDRRAAIQVLVNLLSNAVKYTSPAGRVTVRARTVDRWVGVDVVDSGPGLTEEELGRIFVPFERLDVRPEAPEGVGLGLSLARAMAEELGGGIDVRSTPGAGSTFTLRLPRAG